MGPKPHGLLHEGSCFLLNLRARQAKRPRQRGSELGLRARVFGSGSRFGSATRLREDPKPMKFGSEKELETWRAQRSSISIISPCPLEEAIVLTLVQFMSSGALQTRICRVYVLDTWVTPHLMDLPVRVAILSFSMNPYYFWEGHWFGSA